MGFFDTLGGIGRAALPVVGGALGGPAGAAIGGALGSSLGGGGGGGGFQIPGTAGPVNIPGLPDFGGGGGLGGIFGSGGAQQGINAFLSGLDFQRRNEQLGDLQGRSAQDFQARLPLQDAFLQSFVNQNQLQAPNLASTFQTQNPFNVPAGPVNFTGNAPVAGGLGGNQLGGPQIAPPPGTANPARRRRSGDRGSRSRDEELI